MEIANFISAFSHCWALGLFLVFASGDNARGSPRRGRLFKAVQSVRLLLLVDFAGLLCVGDVQPRLFS